MARLKIETVSEPKQKEFNGNSYWSTFLTGQLDGEPTEGVMNFAKPANKPEIGMVIDVEVSQTSGGYNKFKKINPQYQNSGSTGGFQTVPMLPPSMPVSRTTPMPVDANSAIARSIEFVSSIGGMTVDADERWEVVCNYAREAMKLQKELLEATQ